MNALVLGGNGFIGSHLVDSLIEAGHKVRVFDRFQERYRQPLADVDYVTGQLSDAISLAEALVDIDVVYHLVSTTVPSTSNMDPATDVRDNLLSTLVLLDQMLKVGVKRIVYLSSGGTVYGNPRSLPIAEDHPLNPICSYGIVKVAIENYLFMYQQLHGLKPIVLRPSNPFGPRQGHVGVQGLIATFLGKVKHGEPLHVWGDGSIVRDYFFVTDLAQLSVVAGESDVCGVFNVGYGSGTSVNQIIEAITEVTGIMPQVCYGPARSFDVHEVVLDIAKCRNTFNWEPKTALLEGIRAHWQWFGTIKDGIWKLA